MSPFSRLCTVIDSLGVGGAERLVTTVHKYLASEMGVYPAIVTLFPGGRLEDEVREAGVRIISLGDFRQVSAATWISRFRSFLAAERPGFVHGHLFPVNYLLAASTLGLRRPVAVVFSEHNVQNRRRRLRPLRLIEKAVYSRFARIICVSEEVRRAMVGWLPSVERRAVVLKNCVEMPRVSAEDRPEKVWDIVAVGSLTEQKGFRYLVEAVALLQESFPQLSVAIAGEGPLKRELSSQIAGRGLNDRIRLLGSVEDVPGLLASSRVFVLPSGYEGLPMALLEAMAAGLPVVATRVGGVPEIVQHTVSGLLVEPGSPVDLARAVAAVLQSPALAATLGGCGRLRIEGEASVARHVEGLAQVLTDVS